MIKCPKCGKDNENDSIFCIYCGSALKEAVILEKKQQVRQDNKKWSKVLLISLLVVLLAGIGAGGGAYYYLYLKNKAANDFVENYKPDDMLEMIYPDLDDLAYGDLYDQKFGEEKQLIAHDVAANSYIVAAKSAEMAYLDKDNTLYFMKLGSKPKKISSNVQSGSTYFTEDETMLIYAATDNEMQVYDISQEKASKLGTCHYGYMEQENRLFYYTDDNGDLYRVGVGLEPDKLADDVSEFQILDTDHCLCGCSDGSYMILSNYGKHPNKDKLHVDGMNIYDVKYDDKDNLLLFTAYEDENQVLYAKLPDQKPIKLAKKVCQFDYYPELRKIYYQTSEDRLFSLEMPKINKKAKEDEEYFEKVLEDCDPKNIMEDCIGFSCSPDGRNVVGYDKDNAIYLCKKDKNIKLATSLIDMAVFNDYVYYITEDNKLYVQFGISSKNASDMEKPTLLADNLVGGVTASEYGRYLTFYKKADESDQAKIMLLRYEKGKSTDTMLEDVGQFDQVCFMKNNYDRTLQYSEIKGSYYCETEDCLFKFNDDESIKVYHTGVEQGSVMPTYTGMDRGTLTVTLDGDYLEINTDPTDSWQSITVLDDGSSIRLCQDKSCKIYLSDGTEYALSRVTDDEFDQKIEQQKKAEEERKRQEELRRQEEERQREEQARRDALYEAASSYYDNGVYLSGGTYVYDSPDYNSITQKYTTNDGYWDVYDFWIDYDASVIWVKIYGTSDYGVGSYNWVPITQ